MPYIIEVALDDAGRPLEWRRLQPPQLFPTLKEAERFRRKECSYARVISRTIEVEPEPNP